MKSRHLFLLLLLCLGAAGTVLAQTHTPRYVSMCSKSKGYYEYLPEGYDPDGTATYPLILFMTGIGEFGNGSPGQLPLVLKWGIPQRIENGSFPDSFVVNGETHRFIVITPQFIKFPRPTVEDMDTVLNYIEAHYKVNRNRIYITGLSYGGGLSFAYAGSDAAKARRVAAIVPIASPVPDGGDSTIYARSRAIAANNVAVWATHNLRDQDDTVATTIAYINYINEPPAPTPRAKMTLFDAGGHNAWTKTYSPTFKEDGLNVYEWMLQYQRNIVVPNKPPQAGAGADQTITLPANSVTLKGSGTDPDGSITAYNWTKVSGPNGGAITTPAAATTTVTSLAAGTYVFRLTVTDNSGATASDDVNVVVNAAPNQAPQAQAGADQTITLPANTATLTGSGTDNDGTIATYRWSKVSGPAGGSISTPNAASTTVTALQEGAYVFRLTVTDNEGLQDTDDVTITVNAAPNQAPQANAGADKTITLPTNSVTLQGTGTDTDGSISSYAWTKVSGPAASITNPDAATTTVTGLTEGTYLFRLVVTDNKGTSDSDDVKITVNAAANSAPVANAGADIAITLPVNEANLQGSGTDADGTIASYLWTKVSGPAGGTIADKNAAATAVTGLQQGTYVFRLTVTDNSGATDFDEVTVAVNSAPNQPPVADAGADKIITLPVNTTTLTGSGTDADGSITTYAWSKVSGPSGGALTTPTTATTTVTGLVEGTYVFRLVVTDNNGATGSDEVKITVNAAANQAPVANAGADIAIVLPVTEVNVQGSGTDTDGTIASYLWTNVSGPAGSTITNKNAAATTITGLVQGTYVFRLTVTDNKGATDFDDVQVTVNRAQNQAPAANAGADKVITLPVNTTTLTGSGTDADGTISTYAWTKVSGPAGGVIATPAAAQTALNNLAEGVYTFRLTVTDNDGASNSDEVSVTVHPAPAQNKAPTAAAGVDQSIILPTDTATLNGTATDDDGTINTYAWTKVSGPEGGTLATPNAASTKVTGLQEGSYVYRLTVTDNEGATATDDVTITVTVITAVDESPVVAAFSIIATPNPTATHFALKLTSASPKSIRLRLIDAAGHVVEERISVPRNTPVTIGHQYRSGVYYAEAVQNGKRVVVKLLKL